MKICVWRTGHEISDTVAEAVYWGLMSITDHALLLVQSTPESIQHYTEYADLHIGYGILRGMDEVFKACDKAGKPWFNIDRGYWKPGHYDGYYRISLRGTQQTFGLDKLKPDYERWDSLGLEIREPLLLQEIGPSLLCPPTNDVCKFFNTIPWNCSGPLKECLVREKGCERPLEFDLQLCSQVITFNSSVGWEALRQGIPVVSDPTHSIIGAYQKMLDIDLSKDSNERRKFFAIQAGLQLRLDEFKQGLLWPLLKRLLDLPQKI